MKALLLIFTVASSFVFSQQKKKASLSHDSLAIKNVNSILNVSKKEFSNSGTDFTKASDLNKNLDKLLVNTINFNSAINDRAVNSVDVGTFANPRIDPINFAGRKLLSVPVYKSK